MSDIDLHYTDILRRAAKDVSVAQDKTDIALQTSAGGIYVVDSTFQGATSMASDFISTVWNVSGKTEGAIQATWENITASGTVNGTMILEGALTEDADDHDWNDIGGNTGGRTIRSTADSSQIWVFTTFGLPFVRLVYTANNLTGGSMTIQTASR